MFEQLQDSIDKLHGTFERSDLEVECRKMQQKIEEARYNPGDVRPLADCIYSLLLAAKSRGFSANAVLKELDRVAADNLKREWKKMPDGTYQSIDRG
jgi:hypothetical protein